MVVNTPPGGDQVDQLLSVSDVARRLGVKPRDISNLFYHRELRDDICPIVGGRRLIPEGYVGEIQRVVRRHRSDAARRMSPQ